MASTPAATAKTVEEWIERTCTEIERCGYRLTEGGSKSKVKEHLQATLATLKTGIQRCYLEGGCWKGNATNLDMRKFLLRLLDEKEGQHITRFVVGDESKLEKDAAAAELQELLGEDFQESSESLDSKVEEVRAAIVEITDAYDSLPNEEKTASAREESDGRVDELRQQLENLRRAAVLKKKYDEINREEQEREAAKAKAKAKSLALPSGTKDVEEEASRGTLGRFFGRGKKAEEASRSADAVAGADETEEPGQGFEDGDPLQDEKDRDAFRFKVWAELSQDDRTLLGLGVVLTELALQIRGPAKISKAVKRGGSTPGDLLKMSPFEDRLYRILFSLLAPMSSAFELLMS